jgi:hypothetical protein
MRRGQTGTATPRPGSRSAPAAVPYSEESDREWLTSLFDAFTNPDRDLDSMLAWKTRRLAKARETGLTARIRRTVASAPWGRPGGLMGTSGEPT